MLSAAALAGLDYRVLGPIEIGDRRSPVDLGRPKQRALLAVLLAQRGRVVSTGQLVDRLWDDDPPDRAEASIQAYVSNLRRLLEPERAPRAPARVLVSRPSGYLLQLDGAQVDAARFEALAAEGHEQLGAGQADAAFDALSQSLALWRGRAFGEFADEPWALPESTRLEELRATVVEDRADAALLLGRQARLVAELEPELVASPLRERLRGLLVRALYSDGRQADALRVLDEGRKLLAEELGLDPDPELQKLETAILRHELHRPFDMAAGDGRREPGGVGASGGLVGRAPELAQLRAALDGRDGGAVVVLSGELGIGKTTLAELLAGWAADDGATVAWGRCLRENGAPALWPLQEIATTLRRGDEPDPMTAGAATVGDPGSARFAIALALTELLRALAAQAPVVVVVEDLHWADPTTVAVLGHLVPALAGDDVVVVLTTRPTTGEPTGGPTGDLLADVARLARTTWVEPGGLGPRDVGELIAWRSIVADADEVVARTAGNPFFVTQLLDRVAAGGDVGDTPPGVREVVRARVDALPTAAGATLELVAVAGGAAEVSVLAAAAGGDVADAVDQAVASGLLTAYTWALGRYRFPHPLVSEVVYEGIGPARRAGLHRRLAEALEERWAGDLDAHLDTLAWHFGQGAAHAHDDKALDYAWRGAERAEQRGEADEAARLWHEVLQALAVTHPADGARRFEGLCRRARNLLWAGDVEEADHVRGEAIDLAEQRDDAVGMARAAAEAVQLTAWDRPPYGTVDWATVNRAQDILDRLGDREPALRARLLALLAVHKHYDEPDHGDREAREAVAVARRLGDPQTTAIALSYRILTAWGPEGMPPEADQLLELGDAGFPPGAVELLARTFALSVDFQHGRLAEADAGLARCRQLVQWVRPPSIVLQIDYHRATRAILAGDIDEAWRLVDRAHGIERRLRGNLADNTRQLYDEAIMLETGRSGEMAEFAAAMTGPGNPSRVVWSELRAWCLAESGDLAGADATIAPVRAEPLVEDWTFVFAACLRAGVRCHLGLAEDAAGCYANLLPFRGQLGLLGTLAPCLGAVDYFLARLALLRGDDEATGRHFAAAIDLNTRLGARSWLERTRAARADWEATRA